MRKFVCACLLSVGAVVAAAEEPADRGATLYAENCLECHGPTATEGESGDIRGLGRATVTGAVLGGMGDMPTFSLRTDEIAAISAYLDRLARE
jgi:mono/diheme cytochrome c family protein